MKSGIGSYLYAGLSCVLAVMAAPAVSDQYVLTWEPVNDARITGYTIYRGAESRIYDYSVSVGNQTTFTFTDLDPATVYYFAVRANSRSGAASDSSNEITSGYFRYVFGMGASPEHSGQLEVVNLSRIFEQNVRSGWSAYNELSGEARVATGDIDGDGRDEIVIGFAPVNQTGIPGGRFQILDDDFSHLLWGQVDWSDYNAASGETRPAIGDIDGDGKDEIIIGLGQGGDGKMAIFRLTDRALAPIGWADINWPEYGQANGETWPALGDIDGDGRDELVIGLGGGGFGTFLVKNGFDAARLTAGVDPWLDEVQGNLSWAEYANQVGETRPALGDLSGDGNQEIVIGLGPAGGGTIEVFDYVQSAVVHMASAGVHWPDYNIANGETRPAIGDIDGDQRGEILVGLGAGGGGYVDLFDDAQTQFLNLDSLRLGTAAYQAENGGFWPAVKQEHDAPPEPPVTYLLSVLKNGTGSGVVAGGGRYPVGTTVTPTATAGDDSTFNGWTPSSCGTSFALGTDTTCTAAFTLRPKHTLTVTRSGSGDVTSTPRGINCGSDCTEAYVSGTVVTLLPVPAGAYRFSGWSNACTGTGACVIAMSAAKSARATFTAMPKYTLTVKRSGSGTVTSAPAGIACGSDCKEVYLSGTAVALTPTPTTGYLFSRWSGACTGTGPCTVTLSGNKTATAYFIRK
ncbi:FG-GAP-like repeat-containing protein [uncultured Lamprocystis sp.]|uniref:InlB B-repeat-containing protein n=1 Tax=uncultured Lamprocystis sp. TaxID=543132 RepID=UPI0025D065E4|nr:FG-GAP-like repeat-containing protein [uncultured Lamprocystis sp.]